MPKCMKCMEEYEQTDFCPYCGRKRDAASVYTGLDFSILPGMHFWNRKFISESGFLLKRRAEPRDSSW